MMLFGTHPLMAHAIVGLGAAAYSPAKYGILTELPPAVAAGQGQRLDRGPDHRPIILGVVLGGRWWAIGRRLAAGYRRAGIDFGIDTAPEAGAGLPDLRLRGWRRRSTCAFRTPAWPMQPMPDRCVAAARVLDLQRPPVARQAGPDFAGHTTLFWGAGANLKYIVLAWAGRRWATAHQPGVGAAGASWPSARQSARCTRRVKMTLDRATNVIPLGIGWASW